MDAGKDGKLVLSKQWFIDSHQGNIKDAYHFVERLGSGGFGVVYLAEDRKTSKYIQNSTITKNNAKNQLWRFYMVKKSSYSFLPALNLFTYLFQTRA